MNRASGHAVPPLSYPQERGGQDGGKSDGAQADHPPVDSGIDSGTGAGAVAVSLNESLQVTMPGGTLSIRLVKDGGTVKALYLTGPTEISQ